MAAGAIIRAEVRTGDSGYSKESPERVLEGDPHESRRNKDKQCKVTRQTLNSAKRAVKRNGGKALLKKGGEHLERSFAQVLDHGGLRRATLRGVENLTRRQFATVMTCDLSLLHLLEKSHDRVAGLALLACRKFLERFTEAY